MSIPSPKRARECSPKPYVANGTTYLATHLIPFLIFITQDKWGSSALFPRVARAHGCQVSPPFNQPLLVLSTPYKSHLPITCRIRLQPHTLAFVRIRLLPVTGGTVVASSGAFTDARSGAAITQVVLRAGQYIIELEVDGPGANVNFTLMVYSMTAGISLAQL